MGQASSDPGARFFAILSVTGTAFIFISYFFVPTVGKFTTTNRMQAMRPSKCDAQFALYAWVSSVAMVRVYGCACR